MSFHSSATSIELDDGHILKVTLLDGEGEEQEVEVDLNNHIGNDNGSFYWDGENFSESAEDIELHREGDDDAPILRAKLGNLDGEQVDGDINLAERFANNNGQLEFV
ncbi:hypothetical protein N7492_000097 [Penicillium capsulatum]|uniref:Cyanovirin-N domain-containing protein n=1 Tax=Penicillium capsulatum TaxID=69766 RepID=A0A9W9IS27_9EURO|nr:hypothetical protein N7492_000097 [Penicillium capsulatum]KAJ6130834.1 hypothetical protein N7512_003614 [Penicillium capsulatum]